MRNDEKMFLKDVTDIKASMLRFATGMLGKFDEFLPFARVITGDGRLVSCEAPTDAKRHDGQVAYDNLRSAVGAMARKEGSRAIGLCSNVISRGGGQSLSGIRMVVEYFNGAAIEIVVPYEQTSERGYRFFPEQIRAVPPLVFDFGS